MSPAAGPFRIRVFLGLKTKTIKMDKEITRVHLIVIRELSTLDHTEINFLF